MNSHFLLCLVLLCTTDVSVTSRFVVEKSSITVMSPEDLKSKHDGSLGNFGVPDYGGSMMGVLFYPSTSSPPSMACDAFDSPFKYDTSGRPLIVLIHRGGCFFALNVWNAQQDGAKPVLVVDDRDEPLITMESPEESQSEAYIRNTNIPSALIGRFFGESLKKALNKGKEVVIKIDWRESMPHPDNRVEYELWTNSNDECGVRCDE